MTKNKITEAISIIVGGFLLAIGMNWPLVPNLSSKIPQDTGDPLYFCWILAWPGHALTEPSNLWQGNIHYPEPDSYAFTDSLLGYLPFSLFGEGTVDAVTRYNIVFLTISALAFIGGYALVRQLGSSWIGALLAGIVIAYAPWRLAQSGHLNILSTGGIALVFFALARGHGYSFTHGYQPEKVRPGWAIVGWLIACWQITLGFAIGLWFVYLVVLIVLIAVIGWFLTGRPALSRRLLIVNTAGVLAFLLTTYLMLRPYLRIVNRDPGTEKTVAELKYFAPPLSGLFTSPAESWLWGDAHQGMRNELGWPPEMTVLPGMAVLALAAAGIFYSIWQLWIRIGLTIGMLFTGILALGPNFFGGTYTYLVLWHLPGWNAIRTTGRMMIWTTFLLALLAAGLLTKLGQQLSTVLKRHKMDHRLFLGTPAAVVTLLLLPIVIAVAEGFPVRPYPTVPKIPASIAEQFDHGTGPFIVLPFEWSGSTVVYWSTDHFPKVVTGPIASYMSQESLARSGKVAPFPDVSSVSYLRDLGIRTVIVLRAGGSEILSRSTTGLNIDRTEHTDAVVFKLR